MTGCKKTGRFFTRRTSHAKPVSSDAAPSRDAVKSFVQLCATSVMRAALFVVLLPILVGSLSATAADYIDRFEGKQTSWKHSFSKSKTRLVVHERNSNVHYGDGRSSEHFHFAAGREGADIVLGHRLPAARCIDDLELTVWVRSNRAGMQLALRVVFPEDINPTTGKPIKTVFDGGKYNKPGEWQQLSCKTLESDIRRRCQSLRAKYPNTKIEGQFAYVNAAILRDHLEGGSTEFFIDDLRLNPVVTPRLPGAIVPISHQEIEAAPPVRFHLGRLTVDQRPFYLRVMAYHGENLDGVKAAGFNSLWVKDYRDQALTEAIRSRNMWIVATPKRLIEESERVVTADVGRIDENPSSSPGVLVWNLGTDIPPSGQKKLIRWVEQIRTSDRRYKRPIMGSVIGNERLASRHLQMIGIDQSILNTTTSFKQYRDQLIQKRRVALPGSFMWSWLQTEPDPGISYVRSQARQGAIVIEPEQIRALTYATWAAGYRGHGYRKTTSLDAEYPGAFERRAVITQLNLESELIGPILAEGVLEGQVPFEVELRPGPKAGNRNYLFKDSASDRREVAASRRHRNQQRKRESQIPGELEAAVIRTKKETLVLPIWYGTGSQFTPSKLAANNARIVVPGVSQSARAVEITTTGIRSLERRTVSGGVEVVVPYFDQTAAVLFTSDVTRIEQLRQQVRQMASRSARASIDLARAKLVRTQSIDSQLHAIGHGQPDAPQLLSKAQARLQEAENSFQRSDFQSARQACREVMQNLRILQRSHWNEATERFASPVASPHTLCFQTLPDHWKMIDRVGRASGGDRNLLRSGDFEDKVTMVESGWSHFQNPIRGINANADLITREDKRGLVLRMKAIPATGVDPPVYVAQRPVWVTSPAIPVQSGQIVHISGQVKLVTPVIGSLEGVTIRDNLMGDAGAIHFRNRGNWTGFELIREVHTNQDLAITFSLNGMGEVQFDNVQVKALNLQSPSSDSNVIGAGGTGNLLTTPLKLLDRIPKFRPRFGRNDQPANR